ncbi:MarR family transcriptional regulator [Sulfidibacter corallicola]|uniref:MarR family transcriptional regulator n=1 Tax=Sulfidibacter corallicola TaxID=2818388 RepID=A0A8A4TPM0_SULCO|nr:MarR family transcriptional regulator [Sulfidibacter corallicola]QTD51919.1 MarR family transcriptional regulator [Sulfidibacter corallicola]
MNAEPERIYDLIRYVRPLYRNLARAVEDKLQGTGISVGMRAVLEILYDHGDATVPRVAQILGTGRQFIQRMVNDSMAADLVTRRPNPAHRRSWLICLTDKGRQAFEGIRAREGEKLLQVAMQIDPEELATCTRVIDTLTRAFAPDQDTSEPAKSSVPEEGVVPTGRCIDDHRDKPPRS